MAKGLQLETFLTTAQAAHYLGLSKSTLEHWRTLGRGPPWVCPSGLRGGAIRYRLSDLIAWLDKSSSHDGGS